jgi:hypothetical protein
MNKSTAVALVSAGAIKQVQIIANGSTIHVDVVTQVGETSTVTTNRGAIKCWVTIDAAAKWVKALGIGRAQLEISRWLPGQKGMTL